MTESLNHNIDTVEALWPRINQTYRFDNTERRSVPCGATEAGAEYALRFRMDGTQAKALYAKMAAAYESRKETSWPEKLEMPFKKEDDGFFSHKARLKGAFGQQTTRQPAQWDSKGKKLPEDFLLTTGSTINIAVVFVPYNMVGGGAGVSLRLRAVQVLDLKPMVEESPFGVVADGFEVAEADTNPFTPAAEAAEEEEPKKVVKKTTKAAPKEGSGELDSILDGWDG
tara:strand:+ start:3182 stop:3862 length:681 start_codon:yes stop_codon:yes gene_type:complete